MSRIFSAYAVGAMLGPVLGAIGGIRAPFITYLALLVAAIAPVLVMAEPAGKRRFRSDLAALRHPGFWLASAIVVLVVLALGTMDGVLPLDLASRLSQAEIGFLYAGASLLVAASAAASGARQASDAVPCLGRADRGRDHRRRFRRRRAALYAQLVHQPHPD